MSWKFWSTLMDSKARHSRLSSSGRLERRPRDVARGGLPPLGKGWDNRWIQVRERRDIKGCSWMQVGRGDLSWTNTLGGTGLEGQSIGQAIACTRPNGVAMLRNTEQGVEHR